jgi:mono/diheme cytochrome c family protein/cbb3-type cytochrome oxidase cytochrome c subunit
MKGTFYFIILIIIIAVWSCGSAKSKTSKITEYSGESVLVDYGEYIYEREECRKCHTQLISEANENMFSLDHYGGSRSPAWTYLLLIEPKFMIPGCTMPSFKYLKEKKLDKDIHKQLLMRRKIPIRDHEIYWKQFNKLTVEYLDAFKNDIQLEESEASELIPLIAYLQQIPRSAEKRYVDSLEWIEYQKEELAINRLYENSDSIIAATLQNGKSIEKGQQLFRTNCVVCHGEKAQGEVGPNLTDEYWIYGGDNKSIIETIMNGRQNGMPSHKYKFTPEQIGQVAAYIISLKGSSPENAKAPEGIKID